MEKGINKTSKSKLDFERVKKIIADAYLDSYRDTEEYKSDPEFRSDIDSIAKRILEAKSCEDIVDAFIDACWDLQGFILFVNELKIPHKIRKELIAIAVDSEGEWST
jgi:hypothetical protein